MRALISVYDKENIVEFAKELVGMGWDIISTGGSYRTLKEAGIEVEEVSNITKFPEILDGRVKTLHPFIHGGILFRRDNENDVKTLKEQGIESIDMVVNSLYPFKEVVSKGGSHEDIIENIDIGGPSMIRACAKNYKDCLIVTDKSQYEEVIERLKENKDDIDFRMDLAKRAFQLTASYDSLISDYFIGKSEEEFPQKFTKSYELVQELRYGENPHQKAAYYEEVSPLDKFDIKKLHGKELSYNNLNDLTGAFKANKVFDEPCVVAVKHTNPCGIGVAKDIATAYEKAYECDPVSIFGGIIVLNRQVDKACAEKMSKIFLEVIAAPSFSKEALEILEAKKNIRLLEISNMNEKEIDNRQIKQVLNGILVQEEDKVIYAEELEVVTDKKPTEEELKELEFAWKCAKTVASNGVVVAKDGQTLGIGQGETMRAWAVEEALERAGDRIAGAVFASDGFFFKDTMELLKEKGIRAIIQPGGSIKDQEVIDFANENDMAIVFTHTRHFRH
ncbi:bifunctional phosphoribosylaminoimidazolecarboxamide formyltransferase/IMP cyclohydrolase [Lagierella sp.]|uniref:bifunctional phosphoribosylaminoimidazolecarboxamide formyltransferase/IMP cyclohydrolase n=1 Tax=Lagierella sp. TaxID=2849657 RepID=UPI002623D36D|nr:bifunctional phosphoribosylaminoimidazolecarboxamide formyltransferase/IMP cyclohydrolase [Lagierella sp.]